MRAWIIKSTRDAARTDLVKARSLCCSTKYVRWRKKYKIFQAWNIKTRFFFVFLYPHKYKNARVHVRKQYRFSLHIITHAKQNKSDNTRHAHVKYLLRESGQWRAADSSSRAFCTFVAGVTCIYTPRRDSIDTLISASSSSAGVHHRRASCEYKSYMYICIGTYTRRKYTLPRDAPEGKFIRSRAFRPNDSTCTGDISRARRRCQGASLDFYSVFIESERGGTCLRTGLYKSFC